MTIKQPNWLHVALILVQCPIQGYHHLSIIHVQVYHYQTHLLDNSIRLEKNSQGNKLAHSLPGVLLVLLFEIERFWKGSIY